MIHLKVKMGSSHDVAVPREEYEEEAKYPYGTSLRFEGALLEKLGIDPMDLEIGAKATLEIEVEISAISVRSGSEEYERDSVELQVTHIEPGPLIVATNDSEGGGALG